MNGKEQPLSAETPRTPSKKIHPAFRLCNLVMDTAAWLCVACMLIVVLLQVYFREIGSPLVWTEEASRFFFIWMVFLGMAIGFRNVESARVTIFVRLLKPLCGILSAVLYTLFTGGFFLLMLYTGMQMVEQQLLFTEMASGFPLPMWIVGIVYPASAVFGLICLVQSLVYAWSKIEIRRED